MLHFFLQNYTCILTRDQSDFFKTYVLNFHCIRMALMKWAGLVSLLITKQTCFLVYVRRRCGYLT